jgi:hypothetical protein
MSTVLWTERQARVEDKTEIFLWFCADERRMKSRERTYCISGSEMKREDRNRFA